MNTTSSLRETLLRKGTLALCAVLAPFLVSQISQAAQTFRTGTMIRDAEVEAVLHQYTEPIFKAAGLDPENLQLFLIADPAINAFATTNYSIFINTGLILRSKTPEQVIGVLAHETGHIAGGHLAGREGMMRKSAITALASMALGAAAAAAGSTDAAMGLMLGGMSVAQNTLLHYSRGQEGSADQAATSFLDRLHWSGEGLLEFMQILAQQELLDPDRQDLYMRTHPFSQDRVNALRTYVTSSPYTENRLPAKYYEMFRRMVAKLTAFLEPPGKTLLTYSSKDTSLEARYARAIAYFRDGKLDEALIHINALLKDHPSDAYFWELKGQMLFENGRIPESIEAYHQAITHDPKAPLIRLSYAQAILETNTQAYDQKAIQELNDILKKEKDNAFAWHLLATAYGRQKDLGMSALALAEEAVTVEKYEQALSQSKRALHYLTKQSPKLRAEDIKALAEQELKKNSLI